MKHARINEKELQSIMTEHGNYLLRTAYLLIKDRHTSEEVVQDTFVIAYNKWDQLLDESKLRSWLTTIVINECRAKMRKWSWKHWLLSSQKVEVDQLTDTPVEDTEEILLRIESNQSLHQMIQQLDYKYREVIVLFYFNEYSLLEIAALTNKNINTVKTWLMRGKAALRIMLEEGVIADEAERSRTRAYSNPTKSGINNDTI